MKTMRIRNEWRYLRRILIAGALFCVFASSAISVAIAASSLPESEKPLLKVRYYSLPLSFEENRGQADSSIGFMSRGAGFSAAFRKNAAEFLFVQQKAEHDGIFHRAENHRSGPVSVESVRMKLLGANPSSRIAGVEPLPGTANYFIGNDPAKWHTSIPSFARVRYTEIYPGVDLEYYGAQQRLEFDFELAPGADPTAIRFRLEGARKLTLDQQGNLIATTCSGSITFHAPVIYQPDGKGNNRPVTGSFRISADRTVSFAIGVYDRTKSLVIDPILNYSTLLAPSSPNDPVAIAVDSTGNVYVTGSAYFGFPIAAGAFQPTPPSDVQTSYPFVAKVNSTGTALLYSTYLTGTAGSDFSDSIAVDVNGNAYIAGFTHSTDFPVTPGAFQTTNPTAGSTYGQDAGAGFVTKLNNAGTELIYSTYIGGNTLDVIQGLALDASGSAFVIGNTADSDFPTTTNAFQAVPPAPPTTTNQSGFVVKLNPAGTGLVYSTYLSGGDGDWPTAIALDKAGEAYVTGWTTSPAFPITPNVIQTSMQTTEAGFVTKLNSDGTRLEYSTFLGGFGRPTYLSAIAVDASADAYVAGITYASSFPVTPGALDQPYADFVVSKLNNSGTSLVYSAQFGGSNPVQDAMNAIALDPQGNAIVGGCTSSFDYPITPGALETQNVALLDSAQFAGFVSKIDPAGTTFLYSTYFGGSGDQNSLTYADCPSRIALDPNGNVYLVGVAVSPDFQTTPRVVVSSATWGGVFVAELNASEMTSLPLTTTSVTASAPAVEFGQPVTFTAKVLPTSGQMPTGIVGFSFFGQQAADGVDGTGVGFGPWTWVPLDPTGAATYTLKTGNLTLNQIQFNVQYLGDANNAPSTTSGSETLTLIPTTTTITSNQNPALYGTPVIFTATVLDDAGKPVQGAVDFGVGNIVYGNQMALDANGQASWTNSIGGAPLSAGNDTVLAEFFPNVGYASSSATIAQTFTPLGTTPTPTLSPLGGTSNAYQRVSFNDSNSNAEIYYTTNGSTPLVGVSGSLPVGSTLEVSSNETIQAIAVAAGYSPSAVTSATYTIVLPPKNFSLAGNAISVWQGETSNNTSAIVVTPNYGFTGTVTLSAAVTSSPPGAVDPPTLSFGSTNPVAITSANVGRAILTISTTTPVRSALTNPHQPGSRWLARSGAVLACCLIFGLSTKRGRWRSMFWLSALLVILLGSVQACGGIGAGGQSSPGTTVGDYTVTVTGTSGALQQTTIFTITVDYVD